MLVNNDVRKCVHMKESIELLKSLTDVNGIAGYERNDERIFRACK